MSGFRGSCQGGGGIWSGVVRESSFLKCCCNMRMICVGCVIVFLVFGSRIDSRLGWSLALGWSPDAV